MTHPAKAARLAIWTILLAGPAAAAPVTYPTPWVSAKTGAEGQLDSCVRQRVVRHYLRDGGGVTVTLEVRNDCPGVAVANTFGQIENSDGFRFMGSSSVDRLAPGQVITKLIAYDPPKGQKPLGYAVFAAPLDERHMMPVFRGCGTRTATGAPPCPPLFGLPAPDQASVPVQVANTPAPRKSTAGAAAVVAAGRPDPAAVQRLTAVQPRQPLPAGAPTARDIWWTLVDAEVRRGATLGTDGRLSRAGGESLISITHFEGCKPLKSKPVQFSCSYKIGINSVGRSAGGAMAMMMAMYARNAPLTTDRFAHDAKRGWRNLTIDARMDNEVREGARSLQDTIDRGSNPCAGRIGSPGC
jgi:hypothetical protein